MTEEVKKKITKKKKVGKKRLTQKAIQEQMVALEQESLQSLNDLYPQLRDTLDEIGLIVDGITSSSLKKIIKGYAAYPLLPVEDDKLSKLEREVFEKLLKVRDIHIQLAFASVFLNKDNVEVNQEKEDDKK